MGFNSSPTVVTNGLIFAMDQANINSYRGPAITNIAQYLNVVGTGTAAGYSSTALPVTEDIPGIGLTSFSYNVIQNDYPAVSTNCCPSLFQYNGGQTVTPSTLYTYAIVYRCDSSYTNPNYMYRYEYTANGGTYVTEAGIFSTTNRAYLGNGWYWAWATFTTQPTTNWLGYMGAFYYRSSTTADRLAVAKVLLVQGDYTALHPVYWPNVATTRAGTAVVYDQAGGNPMTAANLGYASNGAFSFNGSTSTLIFPENATFNTQTPTIEVWVKTNATTQNGFFFEKGQVNTQYSLFQEGATMVWRGYLNGGLSNMVTFTTASYLSASSYAQVVATFTSGYQALYVNGVLVNSNTLTGTLGTNTNGCSIGVYGGFNGGRGYYLNGTVANLKVYNRSLAAAEVAQNFVAIRGRYGL
jgi:hypothetical protein